MRLERATMESDRFGIEVYRCTGSGRELSTLRQQAIEDGADLVIVRCDASDWSGTHEVEDAGGRLMDTHLTYERETYGAEPTLMSPYRVRPSRPDDAGAVTNLAEAAFEAYGGHFHADPWLAPHATAVYVDWAYRSVTDPSVADVVLLAEDHNGELVGFSTLRVQAGGATGVLDAVSPVAQGRGIYALLGRSRLAAAADRGATRLLVRTHLVNVGARRGLVRLGFLPTGQEHTFHLWTHPHGVTEADPAPEGLDRRSRHG